MWRLPGWPVCLLCIAVLFQGCAREEPAAIRFGLNTAPITLDPRYVTDAVSERICRLIYQRLVDFDQHYQVIPALADWEALSETQYRFTLRPPPHRFHHGNLLTADDVKATIDFVLDEKNNSPHRGTLIHIESVRVVDDNTVDFYLDQSDSLFPGRLNIGILPADLIRKQHPFNTQPVGSGPVKFVQWNPENRLVLRRIADQQALEFITVKDPTVRVLKLARGEIDLIQGNLTQENVHWLQKQSGLRIDKLEGDIFTYIGFNLEDEVTKDLNIRKAVAQAIDRDAIIRYAMDNAARKAGSLLPPDHWAGHTELTGEVYDPGQSRQRLKAAGYDVEHPLTLIYKTSNDPFRIRLATIIQDQLKKVGIDMEIRSYDWGTFYGDIKEGRFQMYSLSWVGLKLPDIFRHVFHSASVPPGGANRGRFSDPIVDALIDEAESAIGQSARATLYRALQERLQEQLPYVPLWYEDNVLATRDIIQGYSLASDGNYDGMLTVRKIR